MKYPDYYAYQFMDGTWRIARFVRVGNAGPKLPYPILDGVYASRAAAEGVLR